MKDLRFFRAANEKQRTGDGFLSSKPMDKTQEHALNRSIEEISERIDTLPAEQPKSWDNLNTLFLELSLIHI